MERFRNTHVLEIADSVVNVKVAPGRIRPVVGFLGPVGTYSEEATIQALGLDFATGEGLELQQSNAHVVKRVDDGHLDLAVVAVENSTEGSVVDTWRELVKSHDTTILGEVVLPIQHMLIAKDSKIQRIYSHPQALGQCSDYLSRYYSDVVLVAAASTAAAAEKVLLEEGSAAIAGRRAAEINKLPILAENIGDSRLNATRFYVIGRGETLPTGKDKTTFVLAPKEDRPGILAECLHVIAVHGINLNKVDTHPTGRLGEYLFLISLDGHQKDGRVSETLDLLRTDYSKGLKVFGSYRQAVLPDGVLEPNAMIGSDWLKGDSS